MTVLEDSNEGFVSAGGTSLATRRAPQGNAAPSALIVFCHGYGGNAAQLAFLSDGLAFPRAARLLLDAPAACPFSLIGALSGARRRQWFALEHPLPARSAEAEVAASWLNAQVDAELARLGLPEDAVWFIGFSQGAMVSLLAGLARTVAPAGIVAIAGALLAPADGFAPACRPPVLLLHGGDDTVVPAERSIEAARRLTDAGIDAQLTILPGLDHVIVQESAPLVSAYIAERVR
jgi:phospholipase/carboxylesterase